MKHKHISFLTTPFVCLILIISMFALPVSANAEAGTLGTETPNLSTVFYDTTGKAVDGNKLKAGDYTVDVVLSNMKAVSIIELTATYTTSVLTKMSVKSTYADSHADMTKGCQKVENGTISVFQVAESEDASTIDSAGTVMVSLSVTVASPCDFADVFAFSTDPGLCFIEASYLDGYEDCYVLDVTAPADCKTYKMTADVSPLFNYTEFDVTGTVTATDDLIGTETTYPVAGITVTINELGKSTVTNSDGEYKFEDLTVGDYTLTFSGKTTIDRTVSLKVVKENAKDDQITVDSVGICIFDYNKDGKINTVDVAMFSKAKTDVNCDGAFDEVDSNIFKNFIRKTVSYTQLNLQ